MNLHMRTNTAIATSAKRSARHFDRGFGSAPWSLVPAVVLLVACSSSLSNSNSQGTAGSGNNGGDAGGTGSECGGWTGAGNCAVAGGAGTGGSGGTTGTGGTTGIGGTGGTASLPACTANGPMFGVCFVNDAETGSLDRDTQTSGAATIAAVGSGDAPASCHSLRGIGMSDPSDWWFQARAADNRLWTIGVRGLGDTPPVREGDVVALDVAWHLTYPVPGITERNGFLQLSDAAGTPVLWAGSSTGAAIPNAPTWISFRSGDYVCGSADPLCDRRQRNVIATVNASSTTLPPYGAGSLDGYFLQVTYLAPLCGDYIPPFYAGAVRL